MLGYERLSQVIRTLMATFEQRDGAIIQPKFLFGLTVYIYITIVIIIIYISAIAL